MHRIVRIHAFLLAAVMLAAAPSQLQAQGQAKATIDNPDCAASSGDFVIEVTVRADGADESNKLKFPESWSREDDASVVMTRRYPIGDDTDLLRIKIRKMRCSCATETEPASNP